MFHKSVDLERHIKDKHGETKKEYKCSKCDQQFYLRWRFDKHSKVHDEDAKFCHYYNNDKNCPFEEFGCAFKHQVAPECLFKNKCRKKMCQYKHKSGVTKTNFLNTLHPNEKHSEVTDDSDNIDENSDQFRYDSNNVLCEHYCSSCEMVGGGYHMDTDEEFKELKGINVKDISEHFDGNSYDFVKTYLCYVCYYKCGYESIHT